MRGAGHEKAIWTAQFNLDEVLNAPDLLNPDPPE
jgi:hypothetical protein